MKIISLEGKCNFSSRYSPSNLNIFTSECPVTPNGSPKEPNYVHGYPKNSQLSPALRNNHIHYSNEATGKIYMYILVVLTFIIILILYLNQMWS